MNATRPLRERGDFAIGPGRANISRMLDHTDLERIEAALDAASDALAPFDPGAIDAAFKSGDDPLTAADLAVDAAVKDVLMTADEGWLSEETVDSPERLGGTRTWVVDPLDGTREFVRGIPEWSVSIGLIERGRPVAGGILAPARGLRIVGGIGLGVTLNGEAARTSDTTGLAGATILASRSEMRKGLWDAYFAEDISIRNMGSVALKLGMVATGLADATWTLVPKSEWDVAAGAALVSAAGGIVALPDGASRVFNAEDPLLPGFVATAPGLYEPISAMIARVAEEGRAHHGSSSGDRPPS